MPAGLASAPPPPIPGALEDDPLTSPSFSAVSATDSRSYSNARKHAKTTPAADGHDNANASYPAAEYADPGYAYQAAPPAAVPAPARAADWYSAPPAPTAEAQAPAYGNPYADNGSGSGGSPAAYADSQATAGYASYLADPLRVYSPPGYEAAAPYAEPGPAAYQQPLPAAGTAPYADGYQQHPYPEQAGYQDGYNADGYAPGYDGGYGTDPYAAGGYGPYPSQG
jgi:hypothetical protein